MPKAVYPGSLDPVTYGHIGAIRDAAEGFGEVVVAIGVNPAKNYMFSLAEREELARRAMAGIPGVTVTSFSGLFVNFLVRNDLSIVVRGVRNGHDFEDNLMQEVIGWQQGMAKDIKAFYVPARPGQTFTSSTALKAVLKEQGDAMPLAPLSTIHATQARMLGQYLYGVTGVSGAGKSSVCRKFAEIAQKRNIPLVHIDLDKIGHAILGGEQDPLYQKTRQSIKNAFGPGILDEKGEIVRKKLGEAVFGNPEKLQVLNDLVRGPMFFRLNDMLRGQKGVFLIDGALLAEAGKTELVNNQMMLVEGDKEELARRLQQRDNLTSEQVDRRLSSQFSAAAKVDIIEKSIADTGYGRLQRLDNTALTDAAADKAFDEMLRQIDIYGELRITGFFREIGVQNAREAYTALRKLYAGDDRFHHTLAHVVEGLDRMPDLPGVQDGKAFMLAWLFRDAAHDSHRNDNEQTSAALLEKTCAVWGVDGSLVTHARDLILASGNVGQNSGPDAKLLADLEYAGLADDAGIFRRHEENLRREFQWMTEKDWMEKRREFLVARTAQCFHSGYFQASLGEKAGRNIRAALTAS